jgi:uncharacterized protein (DUF2126 family)
MTLHVALTHETRYRYDRLVRLGPQIVRLRPAPHSRTAILSYALDIEPSGHFLNWQQDPFGNYLARVVFPEKVDAMTIRVDLVADMAVLNPFDFFLEPHAEHYPFEYTKGDADDLTPYLPPAPLGPLLDDWLKRFGKHDGARSVDFLVHLNRRLREDIEYVIRMEPGVQTPEETLTLKRGSCRDSAWLLVQILRRLGIAARFVSGYLIQLTADVKALDGPIGATRDFTDLHAWAEAYLPGAGWIGLDPTSGLLAGEGHIPLAATPNVSSAAPITGELEPCETTFDVTMSVVRIRESPRVTLPYSDEQWQSIEALGHRIDDELRASGVALTIGGEPTFVAVDDPDGAEWNTEATGPTKRARAADLIKRLRDRFAPDGLLHFGQGKWYPGEQLPRWAFALYWRGDGQPLWSARDLIAEETEDYGVTAADAEVFARQLARCLDVPAANVAPAYEDPWHFMKAEHALPENLDPQTNRLDDPLARSRLARVFERGLDAPAAYVLPVQRWQAADRRRWISERWSTRSRRLLLVPGNSPAGYRLPFPSLPWLPPVEYPHVLPADTFRVAPTVFPDPRQLAARVLPRRHEAAANGFTGGMAQQQVQPVRTALVVEPRDGRLNVFVPPTETADDYLELVTAIEATCKALSMPAMIEGYMPPFDARFNVIKVTPDPGVIEVNIHPSRSWGQLVDVASALYEEAHLARLGTEKFMLDGRHTGTGGGNHIVLGGATPAESPFLRRPDLLQSFVTYWQHHPALSYLFSGLFIGPTSQAPRVDEARNDGLYELELAFTQVPEPAAGRDVPPWLVDRIFRNLLIDVTGNTHRSEICIDKLYSPDGPTGRLGLVEFRAFEMPPHARMSLAQQLLMLALVARFWKHPYRGKLVRWGTRLHDRFMLPYFVQQDFDDVVADMNHHGYPLDVAWYAPHYEFRFPRYGTIQYGDIELELRGALEPWHVMGEEGAIGGTVRYVDSSLERVQVKVTGFAPERFVVACNGCRVPLTSTGRQGEFVGGVRYRAWQPASSLHPTIGVDAPLTFDIHDRWSGRAVAGCTYHVAHPGGRNFDRFPVNAYEAESRRLARFLPFGHTPGPSPEPRELPNHDMPHTLDLRWT